jgi:Golgi phosphoprotein 3 (GPP34)
LWGLTRVRAVLLAEDLLLLLTDDTKGRLSARAVEVDILLAGANLAELALMGRVDISPEPVRLIVRDRSPTGDAVLDETLETVTRWQGPPIHVIQAVIGRSDKTGRTTLYERLVSMGTVRYERRRILRDRWPAQDSRHKVEMRGRVIQALVEQTTPDPRSAALIALLHTIQHEPELVDTRNYGISEQLIARGAQIANSNWAPEAIRHSIDAIIAATRQRVLPRGRAAVAVAVAISAMAADSLAAMAAVAMAAVAMAVEPRHNSRSSVRSRHMPSAPH